MAEGNGNESSVIIEVGASSGNRRLIDLCRDTGECLFLIEPLPHHARTLREVAGGCGNIHVIEAAVSDFDGSATFHVANYDRCSSLQPFHPQVNATWVTRSHPFTHFEMVREIEIPVVRLDSLLQDNRISYVDFIEIDAQGEDLRVVHSLGDHIAMVNRIQMEVVTYHHPLYLNSFERSQALEYMQSHGFSLEHAWRQSVGREENIIFKNKRFD